MSAIERDLIAWTKAKIGVAEAVFGPNLAGKFVPREETQKRLSEYHRLDTALLRRGMRLLRKEQGNA